MKDLIKHILKEMAIPLSVRRRTYTFDDSFIHYRKSLIDYNHKTFRYFWNHLLETTLGTLYHTWFINTVPEDEWDESEKYIADYLTDKYYDETEEMWKKKRGKMNESEHDEWYDRLVKGVQLIDTIMHVLYPNFNKDNAVIEHKKSNAGRDVIIYDDPKTGNHFCSYWVKEKDLSLSEELFETLENYIGEEEMLYIIEWFNNEFNQQAEYVSY